MYESLIYDFDLETMADAGKYASNFLDNTLLLNSDSITLQKPNIISLYNALRYLNKHSIIQPNYSVFKRVTSIVVTNDWIDDK